MPIFRKIAKCWLRANNHSKGQILDKTNQNDQSLKITWRNKKRPNLAKLGLRQKHRTNAIVKL